MSFVSVCMVADCVEVVEVLSLSEEHPAKVRRPTAARQERIRFFMAPTLQATCQEWKFLYLLIIK
jgi:hypothetical protein